jgi:hypothetical protein
MEEYCEDVRYTLAVTARGLVTHVGFRRRIVGSGLAAFGQVAGTPESPVAAESAGSGRAAPLKSFGRRRRTKVADERTRGNRALVYGECDF